MSMSNKLLVLFSFACFSAFGQTITVSGRVTTSGDGSYLPGVNVLEKGTTNGTTADLEGRYTIDVTSDAVLIFSFIGYRTKEVRVESPTLDVTMDVDVIHDWPLINVGYGYTTLDHMTTAITGLNYSDFNQGNIYDPAQLWQGKVAGLSIYNRGGNPNGESLFRIRGLSTLDPDSGPLIVIDGVPQATLHNLDPQDIESISTLKDGAAAAIYGMRASQGVILVTTKGGSPARGLSVNIQTEGAASTLLNKQPVMTAAEQIAAGGNDLTSATDWQDEITRTGLSFNNHVSISGANSTTSFRVASHIRSVNGILLHSGFDQVNTRVNFRHAALGGRLRFNFNMAGNNRKNYFSFPEAFRYANTFLPTAPVLFPSGDYYQPILFDNYNPVAMLEQNASRGRRRNMNYSAKIDFEILKDLVVTVNTSQQFENDFNGKYYSRDAFYIGQHRGGLVQRHNNDRSSTLAESYLSYSKVADKIVFNVIAGFSYQQDETESIAVELDDLPNDDVGYNAIGYFNNSLTGTPGVLKIFNTISSVNIIRSGFLRASMTVNDILTFNVSLRQDNSNKLGADQQSGLFPAASASLDLLRFLPNSDLSMLKVRAGYGVTGSIPTQAGLALDQFEYSLNGSGIAFKVRDANPDLKWETRKEFNVGIDLSAGRFTGSIDYYRRSITDLIQRRFVDAQVYPSGIRYENTVGLKGRGLEMSLSYYVGNWGGLTWQPSLVMSTNRTTIDTYPVDQEVRGFIDGPGAGSTQMIRIAVGEKVGDIWGPIFDHVDANGAPWFKDINRDTQLITNPSDALAPKTDFTSLGNGIPTWELGWSNKLGFRNWHLNAFFRGAMGHSLVNLLRHSFEPLDAGAINSYNRVSTDKAIPGLMQSRYSSLYVEKASFIKLDNVTLGYTIPGKGSSWLQSLRVYGTIQNAFVITNYSGIDPEPNLVDFYPANPTINRDPLVPGLDRNATYSPARTFLLGLELGI